MNHVSPEVAKMTLRACQNALNLFNAAEKNRRNGHPGRDYEYDLDTATMATDVVLDLIEKNFGDDFFSDEDAQNDLLSGDQTVILERAIQLLNQYIEQIAIDAAEFRDDIADLLGEADDPFARLEASAGDMSIDEDSPQNPAQL